MSAWDTCCGLIVLVGSIVSTAILLYIRRRNIDTRCLKKDDNAVVSLLGVLPTLLLLVFGIIVILVITGLIFGIFTLIGICLLAAAAFVLYMKKGDVTIAPKSAFMWLLVIGLILAVFGQVVMDIGSFDMSTIPVLDALHDMIRVD